jgi:glycosyltransferase involved in cell wall biosynthesis
MLTHISNNYLGSTVHSELAAAIARKGIESQFVYCPLQRGFKCNKLVENHDSVIVASPRVFNRFIRYFPLFKVLYSFLIFCFLVKKRKLKPSFIIAHNLWSDGLVALFYNFFTGTPFIVAVRNTDVNFFIPKLPHYRWLVNCLVSKSKWVVFVNKIYEKRVRDIYPSTFNKILSCSIIYNGINREWFRIGKHSPDSMRKPQACYVGSFVKNKNLRSSVLAIKELRDEGLEIGLIAIGGEVEQFLSVTGLSVLPNWIEVLPRINDRKLIGKYMRRSRVFLMPSFSETFGLVYIEALSQGCCIVHSRGEGIDGLFNEPFIRGVSPHSITSISSSIKSLVIDYPSGVSKLDVERLVYKFSWESIADRYLEILQGKSS